MFWWTMLALCLIVVAAWVASAFVTCREVYTEQERHEWEDDVR